MTSRKTRHAVFALLMLLVQVGSLQQLTNIPPEVLPQLALFLPLELVLTLAWALIFAWLAVTLWRGAPTRRLWLTLLLYAAISLARLLIFARADYWRARLPALLFALLLAALALYRYRTEDRQKSGHDRES